jgi:hypothetical protein
MLLLILLPSTRWIVKSQVGLIFPTIRAGDAWLIRREYDSFDDSARGEDEHRVALGRPGEYLLQLGDADECAPAKGVPESRRRAARIRALEPKFPGCPAIRAIALRYDTAGSVQLHRPEEQAVDHDTAEDRPRGPIAPQALADYLADAAAGERLAPDNAYFPMMAAIGLFAAHRDVEATSALKRACSCKTWRDYRDEELRAKIALFEATFGRASCQQRVRLANTLTEADFGQIWALGRTAVGLALEAEQTGWAGVGLAIRLALLLCGVLIRDGSCCVHGTLLGIHLGGLSIALPGGPPELNGPDRRDQTKAEELLRRSIDTWTRHLDRIGRSDFASGTVSDVRGGDSVRLALLKAGTQHRGCYAIGDIEGYLGADWAICIALLASALACLGLNAGAVLYSRAETRLPSSGRRYWLWPLAASGVFVFLLAPWHDRGYVEAGGWTVLAVLIAIAAACCFALPPAALRALRCNPAARSASGFALMLLSALVGMVPVAVGPTAPLGPMPEGYPDPVALTRLWQVFWLAIACSPPVLLLAVLSLVCLRRRKPLISGVARGLRKAAAPTAWFLLAFYALSVVGLVDREGEEARKLDELWANEARVTIREIGDAWPAEATPIPVSGAAHRGQTR